MTKDAIKRIHRGLRQCAGMSPELARVGVLVERLLQVAV